ncbi:MAG: hydroxysqualene dehydroxylase HpnE [Planctomycetota bacterium]
MQIAIIGGGLAGMAAALRLADRGFRPVLFESRNSLGGRAGYVEEPRAGLAIDFCQHVALGCCTHFLEFCRRAGIDDALVRHDALHFFGPDGRRFDMRPSAWLPPKLTMLPSLMQLGYLTWRQRLSVVRACAAIRRPIAGDRTFSSWLRERRQHESSVRLFWRPIVESALSDTVDRVSLSAVRQVFVEGLLAGPDASAVYTMRPSFGWRLGSMRESLCTRGVDVRLRAGMAAITTCRNGATVHLRNGDSHVFAAVIVAVPWYRGARLLSRECPGVAASVGRLEAGAITAVHLWFDRPVTTLDHGVLPGRLAQWFFCAEGTSPATIGADHYAAADHPAEPLPAEYIQVVVSASHAVASEAPLADRVCGELAEVLPNMRNARLVHSRVLTHRCAVFSPLPGSDALRPAQDIGHPRVFLAGDWTATGWPATMEGAVRSGELAAEAVMRRKLQ